MNWQPPAAWLAAAAIAVLVLGAAVGLARALTAPVVVSLVVALGLVALVVAYGRRRVRTGRTPYW